MSIILLQRRTVEHAQAGSCLNSPAPASGQPGCLAETPVQPATAADYSIQLRLPKCFLEELPASRPTSMGGRNPCSMFLLVTLVRQAHLELALPGSEGLNTDLSGALSG